MTNRKLSFQATLDGLTLDLPSVNHGELLPAPMRPAQGSAPGGAEAAAQDAGKGEEGGLLGGSALDSQQAGAAATGGAAIDGAAASPQAVYNDPLLNSYWHLGSRGGATKGVNAIAAWDDYRGKGVVVGLIDDGVDYNHPDLNPNYGFNLDYDARDSDFDAYPSDPTDRHGTAVAGVVGAALNNATGGAGVAPEATLVGYRIGFGANGTDQQLIDAYQRLDLLDVANNSWGYDGYFGDNFLDPSFDPITAGLYNAVDHGRGGLGTIVVFAAGNGRGAGQDVNYHSFQNDRHIIAAAATDSAGNVTYFSTPGAAILVAAPGQSVPTTDRLGAAGYSSGDYTSLSGTSFSAPIVSGTAALMLDANPNLGWRDVQEILASTAVQTGGAASWSQNHAGNWNGGAMHVSNDYGFGLVDALAAVRVAESWRGTADSSNEQVVSNLAITQANIPDQGSVSSTLSLPDGLRIDHVAVEVVLQSTNLSQLKVTLTSPDGTQSLLMRNPNTTQSSLDFNFSTTRDWGELSGGDWTLTVTDTVAGGPTGKLYGWALNAYGDLAGNDTYVYTNEFATLAAADPARALLTDASGADTLNAAAVTADTLLDLRPGHGSSLAGQALTIADGTVIENADTGDGNDTLVGNDADNSLRGWRGNDYLDGGLGADTLEGFKGNDTYVIDNPGDKIVETSGVDTVLSSIDYTLASDLENLTLAGSTAVNGTGNSLDNVLTGNALANHLAGGNGNDALDGRAGADVLDGGVGDDHYVIDNPGDSIVDAAGVDSVASSSGFTLPDGLENLALTGSDPVSGTGNTSNNTLIGNAAPNTLDGGAGNDTLDGGAGADSLMGGSGDDSYAVDDPGDAITELPGGGVDSVSSSAASYTLAAEVENLTLTGTAPINGTGNGSANILQGNSGNNLLFGMDGNDSLLGGNGDDWLEGGAGNDNLDGGLGNDTYVVDASSDGVTEAASAGTDAVRTPLNAYSLGANLENLAFIGNGNFNGTGNAAANAMTGGAGNDTLDGGAGIDTLVGGPGDDTYIVDVAGDVLAEAFGEGSDTVRTALAAYTLGANLDNLVYTGAANFTGTGNAGNNQITGGNGADILNGGLGVDLLLGGPGNDTYAVDDALDGVAENVGAGTDLVNSSVTYTLPPEVENLTLTGGGAINGTGNSLNNSLTGSSAANTLYGLGGNDILNGGAGADAMEGGAGNDSYTVDNAGDVAAETPGAGTDAVSSSITYTLGNELENLTLTGNSAIDGTGNNLNNAITGNAAANTLHGLDGNDSINGGAGPDAMFGGVGNDSYIVDNSGDVVTESPGAGTDAVSSSITYTLGGDVENLTLTGTSAINGTGNSLNNAIVGNAAANALYGLDGNDSLSGGAGIDTMFGGSGNDTYTVDNTADQTVENPGGGTDLVNSSAIYTLGAEVENLTLTGTSAINGTGNNLDNAIVGNAAANLLYGLDGNDSLSGGAGADGMSGGLGDDTYTVDNIGDTVNENAGEGTDRVNSSVAYALPANVENLTLTGTAAINGTGNNDANVLIGNAAANSLTGNGGDDTLNGGAGADIMSGGGDNDTYIVDNTLDAVNEALGAGADTVQSSVTYTLAAGSEIENLTLIGTLGINATGNGFNNTLTGNGGNNILNGGAGADATLGGLGNDTYVVDNPLDAVTEALGAGTDMVQSAIDYALGANLENLTLTGSANINGSGNDLANSLTGNGGNNILEGGAGKDTVAGGLGDDTYRVNLTSAGALEDVVSEAASAGTDTVVVLGTASLAAATTLAVGANQENYDISGTAATLLNLAGSAVNNTLVGNDAPNLINGGAGVDTMAGGKGNDSYTVDNTGDEVVENPGGGADWVNASVSYTLSPEVENLTLTGTLAINGSGNGLDNTLIGNTAANQLSGAEGDDALNGGAGADTLQGGAGNDAYTVDNALDLIVETPGEGTDTVSSSVSYALPASVENLTLTGLGNLNATGNGGANVLVGNAGANTLDGGAGMDTESGGAGNDTFIFRPDETAGDVVLDFFGNGALAGDVLRFLGFGAGASLSEVGATDFWSISYGGGLSETIQLVGVTSLASNDYVFA